MLSENVLLAKLSGAVNGTVAVVRRGKDFYFAKPKTLGGKARKVQADSMTDCLHQAVYELGLKAENKKVPKETKTSGGCGA